MSTNKYHFNVNAAASSGAGYRTGKIVEKILEEESIVYSVYFQKDERETEALTRKLTWTSWENCHLIILGGDGTLNAVLQGIECFEYTGISCIRTASGNDFARNMHITKDVRKALLHILYHPKEKILDYGELYLQMDADDNGDRRRFIISSGIGYDADICEEVSRSRLKSIMNRIHMGKLVYVLIGIKQILTRQSGKALIQIDDNKPIKVSGMFFTVAMIHPCEGGGVPFCPQADPADGRFDICLVKAMPKWNLFLAVMLGYIRKHYMLREVTGYRGRKLTIKTENPEWFHMDGETPCRVRRLTLECKTGLRIFL